MSKIKEVFENLIESINWNNEEDRELCLLNKPEFGSQEKDEAYEVGWTICRNMVYVRLKAIKTQLQEIEQCIEEEMKQMWKKELVEKLPKEKEASGEWVKSVCNSLPKNGITTVFDYSDFDDRKGWNDCLSEVKKVIERL